MTKVFITGATGFIGKVVLREILKQLEPEDRVYILVRKPVTSEDRRVVTVVGDLAQLEKVDGFVRNADFIIHIAGEARLRGGCDYNTANVMSMQLLLDSAKKNNSLRRFIFISSIAAVDRSPSDFCNTPITVDSLCFPRTEYGTSKRMAEEALLESNVPYTIFRPGCVYGPGMRDDSHLRTFARYMRKGLPLHWFGLPGKMSLIHVDDLASAIVKCLTSESGYNRTYLAETEYLPLGNALSLLGNSLFGRHSPQLYIPPMKFIFQRWHSRLPVIVAGIFLDYFWMDDPNFRNELIDANRQKLLRNNVQDIIRDLLA